MWKKLDSIEKRFEEITKLMAEPEIASNYEHLQELAEERASINELVAKYREYKTLMKNLKETREMLNDSLDDEMTALVKEEIENLEKKRSSLEEEIKLSLLPKDPADKKDVIMEIRAGAGGEEAGLFASDLFRMYAKYAQSKGWGFEILSSNETGIGGFREVIFSIKGKGAYSRLKYESGVHRVQRVPATESGGRIHTSTATVAVLPQAGEIDVHIDPNDLKIDTFRSGGAGGQNVNKVSSAVRITHIPTGMVVICQNDRSQLRNKAKATVVLRARLLDQERQKQSQEIAESRHSQVKSGDRSEKIRTYNFPQERVSDHRIGLTLHNLHQMLEGNLDEIIDALAIADRTQQLEKSLARANS